MNNKPEDIAEKVRIAMAYGSVVLARKKLEDSRGQARRSDFARQILNEVIPNYRIDVLDEVQ